MTDEPAPSTRRVTQSTITRGLVIRGDIADTPLADTVQLILSLKRTGQLALERSEPRQSAAIYVEGGDIVHAWCPPLSGSECFHRLLTWRSGRYVFIAEARAPERSIELSGQAMLLDGLRRLDELAQWASRLPPRGTALWPNRDLHLLSAPRLGLVHWRLLHRLDGRTTVGELLDADATLAEPLAELVRLGLTSTVPDHAFLSRVVLVHTVRGARQLEPRSSDLAARILVTCNGIRSLADCCDLLAADPEDVISATRYLIAMRLASLGRGHEAMDALC